MDNIIFEITGNEVNIVVDKTKRLGPSKSGKVTLVANTNGFQQIPGTDLTISMVIFTKKEK